MLHIQCIEFTGNCHRWVSGNRFFRTWKEGVLIFVLIYLIRVASEFLDMSSNQLPSNWDPETGYSDLENFDSYPHRIYSIGRQSGLSVYLRVLENDTDAMCGGGVQGFTVIHHSPNEFPQVDKEFNYVSLRKAVFFTVMPEQIKPLEMIAAYDPRTRHCYFDSERPLRFFRHYSRYNCAFTLFRHIYIPLFQRHHWSCFIVLIGELECLSNFTLSMCGCVDFWMSRNVPTICDCL